MKKLYFFAFTLTIVLWVAACSDGKSTLPDDNSNIVLFQLTPSANGVEEFLEISEIKMLYQNEFCYNVTPQTISDEYGFQIFKLDQCCAGFLLYENEIYTLGEYFGVNFSSMAFSHSLFKNSLETPASMKSHGKTSSRLRSLVV